MKTQIVATLAFCLIFLSGFMFGFHCSRIQTLTHRDPSVSGNVYVTVTNSLGTKSVIGGNIITDLAENNVRDLLAFGNSTLDTNQTEYISFGNSTIAQTKTVLDVECDAEANFSRTLGDVLPWWNSTGSDWAFNVTVTRIANATVTINATGLHWFASGDLDLFALAAIAQTTFNSGDEITVLWVITVDAN